MITKFIMGLLAVIGSVVVITVLVITAKWVTKIVKERLATNKRHKVVFADLRETIDSYTKEQKDKQKEYSMDELEKMYQEAPYVFADYVIDTGEVTNYTGVQAEAIDADVKSRLKKVGGMVVLD